MTKSTPKPNLTPIQIASMLGLPAPTPQQAQVIAAPLEPLLVVAGAGSGKTETMAARVVYLVANGLVQPEEVLGLTFTRKAAGELLNRLQKRLTQLSAQLCLEFDVTNRPQVATYNSFAQSIVREHGLWVGVEPSATLLTEASEWQMVYQLVTEHAGSLDTEYSANSVTKDIIQLAGQLSEHLVTPQQLGEYFDQVTANIEALPWGAKKRSSPAEVKELLASLALRRQYLEIIELFQKRKQETNTITYGDQIAFAAQLATKIPAASQAAKAQYRVVLLDEYQDTSHAQVQFLSQLFGDGHPVTAVGDPNQAIYGWRGASASGLAKFPIEFPRQGGKPAEVLPLTTAWRNDQEILKVANEVAAPLRTLTSRIEVPPLALSPMAKAGKVHAQVSNTINDEAEAIVKWIGARWESSSEKTSAAVLCRTRKQFGLIAEALAQRGIPYEIVGLGGLLDAPPVVDLLAILQAAADPSRGDWLLRLLVGPRVNLGAADLQALGSWAADLSKRSHGAANRASSRNLLDEVDNKSIIDALDNLPKLGQPARDGRALSPEGHTRLTRLARNIRTVRRHGHLSLPEVCAIAEQELGLDIEMAVTPALAENARIGLSLARHRGELDAFREVAANYARTVVKPTLPGFLSWLATAQEREGGLDAPIGEVNPEAVQIITIHGAKGLEWDVVAVAGLVEENFPAGRKSAQGRQHRAWLTDNGKIPYALRGDREDLPVINWPDADVDPNASQALLAERIDQFKTDAGEYELSSERRLAYVAFTRARHEMLLTGYWWGNQTKAREVSVFLSELLDNGLGNSERNQNDSFKNIQSEQVGTCGAREARVFQTEPPLPGAENPILAEVKTAMWPMAASAKALKVQAAAALVRETFNNMPIQQGANELLAEITQPDLAKLAQLAQIFLAEPNSAAATEVAFPAQVSASGLVRLATDRGEFAKQLRRPIPLRPTVSAQVGTQFHEWVQHHFTGVQTLFDDEVLYAETDDEPALIDNLEQLKSAFLNSPWAELTPIAVEQEIHQTISGVPVIARIDAVFPDQENPGCDIVVDWKTGRPGVSQAEAAAREVQLAVYRLAWARLSGKPLDQVSAAFHYVAANQTIRPEKLLGKMSWLR